MFEFLKQYIQRLPDDFDDKHTLGDLKSMYEYLYKIKYRMLKLENILNKNYTISNNIISNDYLNSLIKLKNDNLKYNLYCNNKYKDVLVTNIKCVEFKILYPNITKYLNNNGFLSNKISNIVDELIKVKYYFQNLKIKYPNNKKYLNNCKNTNILINALHCVYQKFSQDDIQKINQLAFNLMENLKIKYEPYIIYIDIDIIYYMNNIDLDAELKQIKDILPYKIENIPSGIFKEKKKYILFDENEKIIKMIGIQKI